MSDTENKTETAAETKTTDTAPYMKKDGQTEPKTVSSKSNIVIPLVLLLVSAIVIVATFYEEEYNDLLAQTDTLNVETTEVTAETSSAKKISETPDQPAKSAEIKTETVVQVETVDESVTAQAEETSPAAEIVAAPTEKVAVAAVQKQAANNYVRARPAYAPYQYNSNNRERTQAMAKQHVEMLQQRRQAYEKEMQDRRTQYEAAMKARQEKRANVAEARKAVFQRAQQNRLETNQKIQEIHNKISELHEEIHQIMLESKRTSAPVQMQSM